MAKLLDLYRSYFKVLGAVAPGFAGGRAARLFLTPLPRRTASRWPEELRASLRHEPTTWHGKPLDCWLWGRGPRVLLVHGWGGLIARRLWETEEGRKLYIATMKEVLEAYEKQSRTMPQRWKALSPARWEGMLEFFGDQRPAAPMAWSFLFDIVHHRGQISTYLRPMGSTVPQIYGPSGDEP